MPGRLRHYIEIQQNDGTQDAAGAEQEVWTTITDGACWAYIESSAGRERFASQSVLAEITHRVVIRYLDGVTPKLRVKHGDRYLDIVSVSIDPEEVQRWMVLDCREIQ